MNHRIHRISKSQYLKGMQCPKALWFYRHRPDLAPEVSEDQQALFDAGHEVGKLAQQYYKNGIEITEEYYEIGKAIQSTEKAVREGKRVVYEATACSDDGAYSKIDIFKKARGGNRWDLIEVKMSTGIKDYHLDDIGLQRYAFSGAGYDIRKSILMHINNQYTRFGALDLKKLFKLQDCTSIVQGRMAEVGANLKRLIEWVNSPTEPAIDIGSHCYAPFECDYTHHCMQHIPDYSVYNIFNGPKLDSLLASNILEVGDVPPGFDMTARQAIEVEAYAANRVYRDRNGIRAFLELLEYPLYFLDYETINPAVPLYDNARPYQQIPFQFSLHIQQKRGGDLRHVEFLHTGDGDPRPSFIRALVESCGTRGSVVVYNQAFEKRINRELGEAFPDFSDLLQSISDRMVDLLVPFRSRVLYHPEMRGSASLKSVLPALIEDMSYDDLEIGDGGTASHRYLCCAKGLVDDLTRQSIYAQLKEYCSQDTLAEARLLEALYRHG